MEEHLFIFKINLQQRILYTCRRLLRRPWWIHSHHATATPRDVIITRDKTRQNGTKQETELALCSRSRYAPPYTSRCSAFTLPHNISYTNHRDQTYHCRINMCISGRTCWQTNKTRRSRDSNKTMKVPLRHVTVRVTTIITCWSRDKSRVWSHAGIIYKFYIFTECNTI